METSTPPTPPSYADVRPVRWWFRNYWWLHISSELLQSVDMVIVKEVICIKLIIPRNKAHKSGHYQFSGECFKLTLLCWVQGKKKRGKDSLILPNQGSNLSERTKPCLTQWIHETPGSIFGRRNEVFFNCVQLNHINGAIKEEVPFRAVYSFAGALNAPRRPDDVLSDTLPGECKTNYGGGSSVVGREIFIASMDGMLGKILPRFRLRERWWN